MNSIYPRREELPKNYMTRLEYMKQNDNSWHYQPSHQDNSAIKKDSITITKEDYSFIDSYSKTLPVEVGTSIYEGEQKDFLSNDLVWRKLDHTYHGYNEFNTRAQYLRKTYEESPIVIQAIIDQTGLRNASAGVIRLPPGNTIPWHYDSHIFFKESNNIQTNSQPERHIIFPNYWDWGHIYQIGNNVLSNWSAGCRYTWPSLRYHLAANVGISDFIMIAVTGVADD